MNIYHVTADINRYLGFCDRTTVKLRQEQYAELSLGGSLKQHWQPGLIGLIAGRKGDFAGGPMYMTAFSMRQKAKDVLESALDFAELLPFTWKKETYWAIFLPRTYGCLDTERSEFWGATPDSLPRTAVFRRSRIPGDLLFRLPGGFEFYCSDEFKRLVQDSRLTGLSLRLVWSDGPPSETALEPAAMTERASGAIHRKEQKIDEAGSLFLHRNQRFEDH